MFVIGHDCGHRSFSKNKLVEDIVGTLMFMPLIYPFEPWRIKHNHHHAHTNKYAFTPPAHRSLSAICVAEAVQAVQAEFNRASGMLAARLCTKLET